MLILARRINESIMIGDQVEISVVDIKGDQVKLGISAPRAGEGVPPRGLPPSRRRTWRAARAAPDRLPGLDGLGDADYSASARSLKIRSERVRDREEPVDQQRVEVRPLLSAIVSRALSWE